MRHTKLRAAILGAASLVLLHDVGAQVGPTVRSQGLSLERGAPGPTLLQPPDEAAITTRPTASTPVSMRWSKSAGAPDPQRYVVCVAEQNTPCEASTAALYPAGTATQYVAQIPPRFHDKRLVWRVAACGPGYGGGFAVQGSTANSDCSWSGPRDLDATAQPPVINLGLPAEGATATGPTQRFTWGLPPGTGGSLDGYRFCLGDSIEQCKTPSSTLTRPLFVDLPSERAFVDVDVQKFRGSRARPMTWTVLSCKAGACSLAPGQLARRFVVPHYPTVVEVTLKDIRVRETCDSASPGDWIAQFVAGTNETRTNPGRASHTIPPSGSRNVSGGDVIPVGETVRLVDVSPDATISAYVSAVDCDADGIWSPFRLFQGTEGIAALVTDWRATCGGEEVWEASGLNDIVGQAWLTLPPAQWRNAQWVGTTRMQQSATSRSAGSQQACAASAFTAQFEVAVSP